KYNKSYLSRIKELAFERNNSYAFNYLNEFYPKEFSEETKEYFISIFPQVKFDSENELLYLHVFLEFLFESGKEEFIEIAKTKLINDNSWKSKSSWFKHSYEKYAVIF